MSRFPTNPLSALPASALLSEEVESEQGEKLGFIKDLMIDLQQGCVSYAVLSVGGLFGIGRKLFAVPWSALTRHGHVFVLQDHGNFLREPLDLTDEDGEIPAWPTHDVGTHTTNPHSNKLEM